MSTVKSNALQIGQSLTATNNFTWYQPASPDGTVRLGNGNSGSVTDVLTVGTTGNLTLTGTAITLSNSAVISAASTKTLTLNGGGGTNGLVLDASNNVGIGTSSPGYKLDVASTSVGVVKFTASGAKPGWLYSDSAGIAISDTADLTKNGLYINNTSNFVAIYTGSTGAERMRLDSSGNLGLGVTPTTGWVGKPIEIGYAGSAVQSSGSGVMRMMAAAYQGSGGNFYYASASKALMYEQTAGGHYWYNSNNVTGSTGASWTPTQAMTLDASGNLLVGTPTTLAKLTVNGNIVSSWDSGSSYFGAFCYSTANAGSLITHNNGNGTSFIQVNHTTADTGGNYYHVFTRNGTAVGQILSVGTTNVSYITSSDQRLKTDLGQAINTSVIENTVVHDFEWKSDGSRSRGVFAQEAYEVNPGAVGRGQSDELNEDGLPIHPWGVDYSKYVPDLIVYCQQLRAEIETLKQRIK